MTTFIGKEVTLVGKQPQVGEVAPDFTILATDLTKKSLSDFTGRKVISVIPSIDTGICSTQTRRFNQELAEMDQTVVITVSCDLPFAQARWCGAEGLEGAVTLSDYYDHSFGKAYGLLMEEWNLLALMHGETLPELITLLLPCPSGCRQYRHSLITSISKQRRQRQSLESRSRKSRN